MKEHMEGTTAKAERLLMIYSRLVNGDTLSKQELAQQFHVTMRSIQRDMESLRCFLPNRGCGRILSTTGKPMATGWRGLPNPF